jgi:hypothetical protein
MKKLAFLLLLLFLLGFNYGCSEQYKFRKIQECKNNCPDDPDFCNRICEEKILNPRWKFLGFRKGGALFYDRESISNSQNFKKVWAKVILNKFGKSKFGESEKEFKNADYILILFNFDCSGRKYQYLSLISFNSNNEIITNLQALEILATWRFISPVEGTEALFKEVCKK